MARVLVVHDTRTDLYFDLTEVGYASWDGSCTGCGYTISEGGTRFTELDDAVLNAIIHLDHQH